MQTGKAITVAAACAMLGGCCTIKQLFTNDTCQAPAGVLNEDNAAASETTRGLRPGDRAPDATLTAADGTTVQLSDLYGGGPIIVTFYRGGWCPFCQGELREWQDRLAEVDALGARLVAISPEAPSFAGQTTDKYGLEFTVLSDATGEAAAGFDLDFEVDPETRRKYTQFGIDLAHINASGTWELVIPATYVIDSDGVIRYAFIDENYKNRADPDEVLAVVRELE